MNISKHIHLVGESFILKIHHNTTNISYSVDISVSDRDRNVNRVRNIGRVLVNFYYDKYSHKVSIWHYCPSPSYNAAKMLHDLATLTICLLTLKAQYLSCVWSHTTYQKLSLLFLLYLRFLLTILIVFHHYNKKWSVQISGKNLSLHLNCVAALPWKVRANAALWNLHCCTFFSQRERYHCKTLLILANSHN